jgi:uncharacterized protein
MNTRNKTIDLIKKTANEFFPQAEILLFGSRARNENSWDSDYDVLIITDSILSPKEKITIRTNIRKSLLKIGIRSDILIQGKKEVDQKKKLPGHIVRKIMREAITL